MVGAIEDSKIEERKNQDSYLGEDEIESLESNSWLTTTTTPFTTKCKSKMSISSKTAGLF